MKNKHYDMIVAKAENMDLVVFVKSEETESGGLLVGSVTHTEWSETGERGDQMPCFHSDLDYFLCLPQHKEVCLHWLNGGKLMIDNGKGLGEGRYTMDIRRNNPLADFIEHPEYTFRIKPMTEKIWVAYHKNGFMFNEVGGSVSDIDDRVKSHELSDFAESDWQYKEIEVTN